MNKLNFKDNTIESCYVYICNLSIFKQCFWTLLPSENSFFIHLWKNEYISVCVITSSLLQILKF